MLGLKRVHHIAIIATDYARSKAFYCDILGFTLQSEFYRAERDSWKGDLALNGEYDIDAAVAHLTAHGVECEAIRVDPFTGKRFTFFSDPDDLPLEIYQQ